jgi:hypothetical protein
VIENRASPEPPVAAPPADDGHRDAAPVESRASVGSAPRAPRPSTAQLSAAESRAQRLYRQAQALQVCRGVIQLACLCVRVVAPALPLRGVVLAAPVWLPSLNVWLSNQARALLASLRVVVRSCFDILSYFFAGCEPVVCGGRLHPCCCGVSTSLMSQGGDVAAFLSCGRPVHATHRTATSAVVRCRGRCRVAAVAVESWCPTGGCCGCCWRCRSRRRSWR